MPIVPVSQAIFALFSLCGTIIVLAEGTTEKCAACHKPRSKSHGPVLLQLYQDATAQSIPVRDEFDHFGREGVFDQRSTDYMTDQSTSFAQQQTASQFLQNIVGNASAALEAEAEEQKSRAESDNSLGGMQRGLEQLKAEAGQQANDEAAVGSLLRRAAVASREAQAAEQDEAQRLRQVTTLIGQLVQRMAASPSASGTPVTMYDAAKVLLDVQNVIQAEAIEQSGMSKTWKGVMQDIVAALQMEEGAQERHTVQMLNTAAQILKQQQTSRAKADAQSQKAQVQVALGHVMQDSLEAQKQQRAAAQLLEVSTRSVPGVKTEIPFSSDIATALSHKIAHLNSKTDQLGQTMMAAVGDLQTAYANFMTGGVRSFQTGQLVQPAWRVPAQPVQVPYLQSFTQPVAQAAQFEATVR